MLAMKKTYVLFQDQIKQFTLVLKCLQKWSTKWRRLFPHMLVALDKIIC